MTSEERIRRMYQHKEADRVPVIDSPWAGTLRRWRAEGMPAGTDWRDYLDIDKTASISVDITPQYEERVIEETDRYIIKTSNWGVTMKHFKEEDSTPEFLDYTVVDEDSWAEAKARMTLSDDRIPWQYLKDNYARWKAEGQWLTAEFWFGFDVTHSWMMGTETTLIAMLEEPELVKDIIGTYLDRCMQLFGRIWDAGYRFNEIYWPDDMGYRGTTFFSPAVYREIVKPFHKTAVDWAHEKGIYARLHSCGNVMTLVDDILETGVDGLNPLEVKAGMDALKLKRDHGSRLLLHGGINAVLWDDKDAIVEEIRAKVPVLKENGGYIFASDHSIPNSVPLENMKQIIAEVKKSGAY
ncbi:MAG: hypothetical protein IKM31_02810 [Oscillospiraceae bacterium]|nr:hypothetical protein [Oscillospiraceae bacterium]